MQLIRRLVWFTTGATAGFGGAMWLRRWLLRRIDRVLSPRAQAQVSESARRVGRGLREAVAEGRAAARRREAELRAELRPGVGRSVIDQGRSSTPVG
ncbi:MAG TPA: hypothetical protein VIL48_00610 [Acidimicrobiales bacterium]